MNYQGDTCTDKAKDIIGKGRPGGKREQLSKGTQENCSAARLSVLGFMVMGLVSGLSLANHSDSESFLVVHLWISLDEFQQGFWEVVRVYIGIFSLLLTFPDFFLVGSSLLVLHFTRILVVC